MPSLPTLFKGISRDLGGSPLMRFLPQKGLNSIGPFVFMDWFGDFNSPNPQDLEVSQHPHIGLATLTYLFQGEILHKDSLGSEQIIKPGDVNLMSSGRGIVHVERNAHPHFQIFNGLQIWIALPREKEDSDPAFYHVPAASLPTWREKETAITLIAGEFLNRKSPVPLPCPLLLSEITCKNSCTLNFVGELPLEMGLLVIQGEMEYQGHIAGAGHLFFGKDDFGPISLRGGTRIILFGGNPYPEARHIHWNFVHTQKSVIGKAVDRWKQGKFPPVPGETKFIAYPEIA